MDFFSTNNRPAKLNQEHAVQSRTNNVVKNNWLNTMKREKRIFQKARLSVLGDY